MEVPALTNHLLMIWVHTTRPQQTKPTSQTFAWHYVDDKLSLFPSLHDQINTPSKYHFTPPNDQLNFVNFSNQGVHTFHWAPSSTLQNRAGQTVFETNAGNRSELSELFSG